MKDQEVTMNNPIPAHDFRTHACALDAASITLNVARQVPPPLKSIADQLIRSANSVPANLAEGNGRCGKDRTYHWRIAYASAQEVDSHLRLLLETGSVDADLAHSAMRLFDCVRAMTWRLIHRKA